MTGEAKKRGDVTKGPSFSSLKKLRSSCPDDLAWRRSRTSYNLTMMVRRKIREGGLKRPPGRAADVTALEFLDRSVHDPGPNRALAGPLSLEPGALKGGGL